MTHSTVLCKRLYYFNFLLQGKIPFFLQGIYTQPPTPRLFQFLRRDVNKAFAKVTGQKVNRGAGYGLEILFTYRLYGPPAYINRMKELV